MDRSSVVAIAVAVSLALAVTVLVVVITVVMRRLGGGGRQDHKRPEAGTVLRPTLDTLKAATKTVRIPSLTLTPTDTEKRIDHWNNTWRFAALDQGSVEFTVKKEAGAVVSFADAPDYPKNGYALVIDERNNSTTGDLTSLSYLTRLPTMDAPINANAAIRNIELGASPQGTRVRMTFHHGYVEVYVNGTKVIAYNDPMPATQISYVGFGTCGLSSGTGELSNIVIS